MTRAPHAMREAVFAVDTALHPEGSCLVRFGRTRVLCTASVEHSVPVFLRNSGQGWVTAEYAMLPRATKERNDRAYVLGSGRTLEIQRFIGRALRAVVDLRRFPNWQIKIDCDVLDADGGTRTAALSGACVALAVAFRRMLKTGVMDKDPMHSLVAAVSCVLLNETLCLDPTYRMDSKAASDANFAMTESGELIEVQFSVEHRPVAQSCLEGMLALARTAIVDLTKLQRTAIEQARL